MRVKLISKSTMILLRSILLLVLHFQVYLYAGAFARPVAVVTGANRGIGHATAGLLADIGYHVIITARDEAKGQECLELFRQRHHHGAVAGQVKQPSMEFLPLDVTDASKAWQMKEHLQQQGIQAPDVLINNAGICIKTEPQGVETYRKSLDVNTWGTIRLAEMWLPEMLKRRKGCVVNISSGDGELAYLQTSAAKRLRAIRSLEELKEYADKVVEDQRDPKGESIAHTPWHAYSFSKAVLNTGTQLMHGQVKAAAAENGGQADRKGVRIYAVCPGDVATGMGDIELQKALTPAQAALDIAWTILHPEQVPSGGFYRARQRIPW